MKLLNIKKVASGNFINFYNATYENNGGGEKVYELISRKSDLSVENILDVKSCAVTIIAFNKEKDKILLNKEFRMAMNREIYNFPCGLIDKGEDCLMASKRELKEETGLDLIEVIDVVAPAFSAIGFSNELVETVFCIADGTFSPSTSLDEEIEANWYSKEEILKMLKTEYFASKTQMYLYCWANSKN